VRFEEPEDTFTCSLCNSPIGADEITVRSAGARVHLKCWPGPDTSVGTQ
jgi:hypothetical protein